MFWASLGATILVVTVFIAYDHWRYPYCPWCEDNLSTHRDIIGSNAGVPMCRIHGHVPERVEEEHLI